MYTRVSRRVRRGSEIPWNWSHRHLWTPCAYRGCWELGVIQEQHEFLTTEPFLHSHVSSLLCFLRIDHLKALWEARGIVILKVFIQLHCCGPVPSFWATGGPDPYHRPEEDMLMNLPRFDLMCCYLHFHRIDWLPLWLGGQHENVIPYVEEHSITPSLQF